MEIYPAIDLQAGRCVRLYKGDFQRVKMYEDDPVVLANNYAANKPKYLHIVDLDGAKDGGLRQLQLIAKMKQASGINMQMGGGIRRKEDILNIFANGIARVVIGSMAVLQPDIVKQWLSEFGIDRVVLALDVRCDKKGEPFLATSGWQEDSITSLWELLDVYAEVGLKHVLCTDINCDGTLQGPNFKLYQSILSRHSNLKLQASGGIASLHDLLQLRNIGISGVIVGKALYEQRFTLTEAIKEVEQC